MQIRARLMQLGSNCRGRFVRMMRDGRALIRFPNHEAMLRSVDHHYIEQFGVRQGRVGRFLPEGGKTGFFHGNILFAGKIGFCQQK